MLKQFVVIHKTVGGNYLKSNMVINTNQILGAVETRLNEENTVLLKFTNDSHIDLFDQDKDGNRYVLQALLGQS